MKKISCLFMVVLLIFSAFGSSSFAITKDINKNASKVIYQDEEITDPSLLLERAKNGITDKNNKGSYKLEKNTDKITPDNSNMNDSDFDIEDIEHYSTTQKLKVLMDDSGTSVTEYVTTDIILMAGGGSNYEYDNDGSYSVKAYSTVYWTEASGGQVVVTKGTGGWTVLDSQARISNRKVKIGSSGINQTNVYVTQVMDKAPTSSSFSYSTPSSWIPVLITDYSQSGVTTTCTITRGTQSWTFSFANTL